MKTNNSTIALKSLPRKTLNLFHCRLPQCCLFFNFSDPLYTKLTIIGYYDSWGRMCFVIIENASRNGPLLETLWSVTVYFFYCRVVLCYCGLVHFHLEVSVYNSVVGGSKVAEPSREPTRPSQWAISRDLAMSWRPNCWDGPRERVRKRRIKEKKYF